MTTPLLHVQARSDMFRFYPPRAAVSDERVPWASAWPGYSPTEFTAPHVVENDRTVKVHRMTTIGAHKYQPTTCVLGRCTT